MYNGQNNMDHTNSIEARQTYVLVILKSLGITTHILMVILHEPHFWATDRE